jgi:sec-independent protein translocase protein TatB
MFDFGFSEVLLTSVIALIVLGPEKLPKAASQVGRWVGRARAMARQFREQLEEEVNLETVKKAHKEEEARRETEARRNATTDGAAAGVDPSGPEAGIHNPTAEAPAGSGVGTSPPEGPYTQPAATPNPHFGDQIAPIRPEVQADTFSHAHPTNEVGANPLTPDGAAEVPPPPAPAATSEPHRPESGEAYASTDAPASERPASTDSPTPSEKSGPA